MLREPISNDGVISFHEWKQQQYELDQRNSTPRTKEQYYSDYGRYCVKARNAYKRRCEGS